MKTVATKKASVLPKSGEQVIREKLKDLNEALKTADLTIVYESVSASQK